MDHKVTRIEQIEVWDVLEPWWYNPMSHDAENPSEATAGDEDQDFNPAESPARTDNPYMIT